ncbi:hypothetical protein AAMO2058_001638700 [Amorphochlora amoebiformis]
MSLFRSNSFAPKVFSSVARKAGREYLKSLRPLIMKVYTSKKSVEIMPNRIKKGESLSKNVRNLQNLCEMFMDYILSNSEKVPLNVKWLGVCVEKVLEGYPSNIRYCGLASLFFLRFLCPVIVAPLQYGIVDKAPPQRAVRSLLLITKTLQRLANIQVSSSEGDERETSNLRPSQTRIKEPYMVVMDGFFRKYESKMRDFLIKLTDVDAHLRPTTIYYKPSDYVPGSLHRLHSAFANLCSSPLRRNSVSLTLKEAAPPPPPRYPPDKFPPAPRGVPPNRPASPTGGFEKEGPKIRGKKHTPSHSRSRSELPSRLIARTLATMNDSYVDSHVANPHNPNTMTPTPSRSKKATYPKQTPSAPASSEKSRDAPKTQAPDRLKSVLNTMGNPSIPSPASPKVITHHLRRSLTSYALDETKSPKRPHHRGFSILNWIIPTFAASETDRDGNPEMKNVEEKPNAGEKRDRTQSEQDNEEANQILVQNLRNVQTKLLDKLTRRNQLIALQGARIAQLQRQLDITQPRETVTRARSSSIAMPPISNSYGKLRKLKSATLFSKGPSLTNISEGSTLTKTQSSALRGPRVPNPTPISTLTKAQSAALQDPSVLNITPISTLTKTQSAALQGSGVSNPSPVSTLTKTQSAALQGPSVPNPTPNTTLTKEESEMLRADSASPSPPNRALPGVPVEGKSGLTRRNARGESGRLLDFSLSNQHEGLNRGSETVARGSFSVKSRLKEKSGSISRH